MRRIVLLGLVLVACHRKSAPPHTVIAVPVTHDTFTFDGELSEPDWNGLGDPKTFVDHGAPARPFSQVRMLRDATNLYVGLYAADQDIKTTDAFEVSIGSLSLSVNPLGVVTPAIPGVRAGHDLDGTLDQPADEDEEWVIELAVPLARIDGATPAFHVRRCDTPKDGSVRCGTWDAQIQLRDGD